MKKPIQERRVPQEVVDRLAATSGPAKAASEASSKPPPVSFEADIMPIFKPFQGPMMWRFDLTDYNAVLGNAQLIFDQISANNMPPPPFPPLTAAQIQTFKNWMEQGCPR